jgi:hypothetical protein
MKIMMLLLTLLLAGCASGGFTAPLPTLDPGLGAEVVVIRPSGFKGCGVAIPVMVDGREVFAIRCGTHLVYPVAAGAHVLAITFPNVVGVTTTNTTPMTIASHERYYLRLNSFLWTGPSLEPMTLAEGERLMAETTPFVSR